MRSGRARDPGAGDGHGLRGGTAGLVVTDGRVGGGGGPDVQLSEIRIAAAAASGASTRATTSPAASINQAPTTSRPCAEAATLPAPNTSTGTYSGSASNATSIPERRIPTVSAATTAPSRLSRGVPSASEIISA